MKRIKRLFLISCFALLSVMIFMVRPTPAQTGIKIVPLDLDLDPYLAEKLSPEDKELFGMLMDANLESVWQYVYDQGYHYCFINELKPIFPDKKMIGRARTMRYLPARPDVVAKLPKLLLNYKSSAETQPGDILVFDVGGDTRGAVTGDVTTALFAYNGGVGVVCDGALRDIPPIKRMGIQVFQRAGQAEAITPYLMTVDYQVPVRIGNVTVIPGDILMCDAHGILVIPKDIAKAAAQFALDLDYWEDFLKTLILQGETVYDTEKPDGRLKDRFEEYKRQHPRKN